MSEKAYVEQCAKGIEIGTSHTPICTHPWDVAHPEPEVSERSLVAVENASDQATIAVENLYPWYMRLLWWLERSVLLRRWLRLVRLFRSRPYQFKDALTHVGTQTSCKWCITITIPHASDAEHAAKRAREYLSGIGYEIDSKF